MNLETYKRVREIFETVLSQPVGKRAAFLDHACNDNLDLRHEVERLLAANEREDEVLQNLPELEPLVSLELGSYVSGTRIRPYEMGGNSVEAKE